MATVVVYVTTTAVSSPDRSVNHWMVRYKLDFGKHVNVPFIAYHVVYPNTFLLQIIQAVQPHIVLVELCKARVNILQLDEKTILEEAKSINFGL